MRTQKLKSHLVRAQSWSVLPLKPRVGQYIAIHATLTAGDFFLACFYPSGPFTCIFFKNLPRSFLALAVANTGSCVGPQKKIGHPVGCRFFRAECLRNIDRLIKHDLSHDDLWNKWLEDREKFVFSPDVILCGWLGSKHQLTNQLIIYPLTARVVRAPHIISQQVSSIFPGSPLPSGTWRTPGLFIP